MPRTETLESGQSLPRGLGEEPDGARYRVLYFMRTADCPVCRQHVRRLSQLLPKLSALGVSVEVFVPDDTVPVWAGELPFPIHAQPGAHALAGFSRTLGAIQQSGTIVASGSGEVLLVRRATVPFQAFDERELFALVGAQLRSA